MPRAFVVLDHQTETDVEAVRRKFDLEVKPHEQMKGGVYEIAEVPRLPVGLSPSLDLNQQSHEV